MASWILFPAHIGSRAPHGCSTGGCGTGIASRSVAAWSGIREASVFDQSALAAGFRREEPGAARRANHPPCAGGIRGRGARSCSSATWRVNCRTTSWQPSRKWPPRRRRSSGSSRDHGISAGGSAECARSCMRPVIASSPRARPRRAARCYDPENERHWCHFFARPPAEVFQSPLWRELFHAARDRPPQPALQLPGLHAAGNSALARRLRAPDRAAPGVESACPVVLLRSGRGCTSACSRNGTNPSSSGASAGKTWTACSRGKWTPGNRTASPAGAWWMATRFNSSACALRGSLDIRQQHGEQADER